MLHDDLPHRPDHRASPQPEPSGLWYDLLRKLDDSWPSERAAVVQNPTNTKLGFPDISAISTRHSPAPVCVDDTTSPTEIHSYLPDHFIPIDQITEAVAAVRFGLSLKEAPLDTFLTIVFRCAGFDLDRLIAVLRSFARALGIPPNYVTVLENSVSRNGGGLGLHAHILVHTGGNVRALLSRLAKEFEPQVSRLFKTHATVKLRSRATPFEKYEHLADQKAHRSVKALSAQRRYREAAQRRTSPDVEATLARFAEAATAAWDVLRLPFYISSPDRVAKPLLEDSTISFDQVLRRFLPYMVKAADPNAEVVTPDGQRIAWEGHPQSLTTRGKRMPAQRVYVSNSLKPAARLRADFQMPEDALAHSLSKRYRERSLRAAVHHILKAHFQPTVENDVSNDQHRRSLMSGLLEQAMVIHVRKAMHRPAHSPVQLTDTLLRNPGQTWHEKSQHIARSSCNFHLVFAIKSMEIGGLSPPMHWESDRGTIRVVRSRQTANENLPFTSLRAA